MKSITDLNTQLIRNFFTVAEAGSIHKAALRLGITQPALSRSIQKLEESLHQRLLTRTRQGVKVTMPGKLLLEMYERHTNWLAELEQRLHHPEKPTAGAIFVGSYETMAIYLWPEFLKQFSRHHPELQVRIVTADSEQHRLKLERQALHLVVEAEPDLSESTRSLVLYRDSFSIYASQKFAGIPGARPPFIYVSKARDQDGQSIAQLLSKAGVEHDLIYDLNTFPSVAAFAKAGLGYAVLPGRLAEADCKSGQLKKITSFGAQKFGSHRICAALLEQNAEDQRLRLLTKELRNFFGHEPRN